MGIAFEDLILSDARVTEVVIRAGGLIVRLRDWQDRPVAITFDDVIAFEGSGPIDDELSHPQIRTEDPLIEQASSRGGESPMNYRCFTLISAWTEQAVLKIVARRAVVDDPSP